MLTWYRCGLKGSYPSASVGTSFRNVADQPNIGKNNINLHYIIKTSA